MTKKIAAAMLVAGSGSWAAHLKAADAGFDRYVEEVEHRLGGGHRPDGDGSRGDPDRGRERRDP